MPRPYSMSPPGLLPRWVCRAAADPDQRVHRLPLSFRRRDRPQHPLGPFDLQPVDGREVVHDVGRREQDGRVLRPADPVPQVRGVVTDDEQDAAGRHRPGRRPVNGAAVGLGQVHVGEQDEVVAAGSGR